MTHRMTQSFCHSFTAHQNSYTAGILGQVQTKLKKRNPNSEPRFSLPSLAHIDIVDRGYFYHVQSELTAFVDVRTTTDGLGFGGGGLVHTSFIVPLKNTKSKAAPGSVWMRVMLRKKKSRKNCLCTTTTIKRNKLECSSRGAEISASPSCVSPAVLDPREMACF